MSQAIVAQGLGRNFDGRWAVEGLTFTVARGGVFGLLGPNGAGKTTTVRLLSGQLQPSAGEVRVLGLDPVRESVELRRRVGVVFQDAGHYERLSVGANLAFFARLHGAPRARVERLLDEVGLAERAGEPVSRLSRGLKQRLALARALVGGPDLLFLDEPTAGLDPVAARQVRLRIEQFCREGGTVFLTTHDLEEAHQICRTVGLLNRGRLVALGPPDELCARHLPGEVKAVRAGKPTRRPPNLEDLFFQLAGRTLDGGVERQRTGLHDTPSD